MKSSVALFLFVVAGCADRGLDPVNTGPHDFAFAPHDIGVIDFSSGDSSIKSSCTQIATWTSDQGVYAFNEDPSSSAGYAWDDYVEGDRSGNYPDGGYDVLYYEFYQPMMGAQPATVPHTIDLTNPNEGVGVVLDNPTDGASGGTDFVATSGKMTVTAIDDTQPTGSVAVHGTNVVLNETDDNGEIIANGACVQIGTFDLSAMYDNDTSGS